MTLLADAFAETLGTAAPWWNAHGILLPESTLRTTWFAVLATFVALNTVMYAALAMAKTLPKLYPRDWIPRRYERSQTRSIWPEGWDDAQSEPSQSTHTGHREPETETAQ